MQLKRNGAAWAIFGMIASGLSAGPTLADTVYTYSGLNFNNFVDYPNPAGQFDNTMRVTGSFTLSTALAPNLPYQDISGQLISYSFSDGRSTITNIQVPNPGFNVSTDAFGNISSWGIGMFEPFPQPVAVGGLAAGIDTFSGGIGDEGFLYFCNQLAQNGDCQGAYIDTGSRAENGVWSLSTVSSVPLPAALPLFATSLGALGLLGWRRKRKAQAA